MHALEKKELLWCLVCDEKFLLEDIEIKRYRAETGICTECYGKMQRNENLCFGKQNTKGIWGYDESTLECSTFCPDRNVCKDFVSEKEIQQRNRTGKSL